MRISPFLLLARKPLLAVTIVSLACALLGILTTSANSFFNPDVLWHTASLRKATARDGHVLLGSLFLMETVTALILGGSWSIGPVGAPADTARARFLLTRPKSRSTLFLAPLLLAVAGLVCIPALTALLLIGWLALVRAPVLGHLIAVARLLPSASHLGAHPGLLPLLVSLHIGAHYLAGFSVGFCIISLFHARRWLIFSQNQAVRRCAYLSTSMIGFLPALLIWVKPATSVLLLDPGSFVLPSTLNIFLHVSFAVAWCIYTLRFIHKVEI